MFIECHHVTGQQAAIFASAENDANELLDSLTLDIYGVLFAVRQVVVTTGEARRIFVDAQVSPTAVNALPDLKGLGCTYDPKGPLSYVIYSRDAMNTVLAYRKTVTKLQSYTRRTTDPRVLKMAIGNIESAIANMNKIMRNGVLLVSAS